jgi:hypothetical protein
MAEFKVEWEVVHKFVATVEGGTPEEARLKFWNADFPESVETGVWVENVKFVENVGVR